MTFVDDIDADVEEEIAEDVTGQDRIDALAPDAMSLNEAQQTETVWRILVWGDPGCHAPGTELLMADGSIRKVEDIDVGDELMGPDSTPRTVLRRIEGEGPMYRITPTKGEPFVVNGEHILPLVNNAGKSRHGDVVEVSVEEWLKWPVGRKHNHKLYRRGVEFPRAGGLPIPPYLLGVLIGDGILKQNPRVCTADEPVVDELRRYADELGLSLRSYNYESDSTPRYGFVNGGRGGHHQVNPLMEKIRGFSLDVGSSEKFIPDEYLTSHRDARLELLAGLLDADGHLSGGCYDLITASEELAKDVKFLVRSLGIAAYCSEKEVEKPSGESGEYYRNSISGELSEIPCRIPRKKADKREQVKSVLRTGFDVEEVGEGKYIGFTVDKDHRYLMGDFTVTHNCGKTHFSYSMPEPVCFIDTERKADNIAHKFDKQLHLWQPTEYDEAKDALEQAIDLLQHYREETGNIGTIVIDSMSVLWGWSQQKYVDEYYPGKSVEDVDFSTGFGSGSSDWKKIKEYHNARFRSRMLDTGFNLCWTAMREDDYEAIMQQDVRQADKPAGEKENPYKASDIIRIAESDSGKPVGILQKSGLIKHRYVGLEYPTFEKHRTLTRDIEEEELHGTDADGIERAISWDVAVTEGSPTFERE